MSFNFVEAARLPYRPRQHNMATGTPLRPHMPMPMPIPMDEHMQRSMPTSPYDIDPRDPRIMNSPFEARMGMDGADYFSAMGLGPLGGRHRRSPLQGNPFPPGLEPDT